jgi:hypothetical protein
MDYDLWRSTGSCHCPVCGRRHRATGEADGSLVPCSPECEEEDERRADLAFPLPESQDLGGESQDLGGESQDLEEGGRGLA